MTVFDTQAEWIILALVFILGLLIGAFLTAGGRRKWKTRYREEASRRETLEREHRDHARATAATDRDIDEDRRVGERRTGDRRGDPE